MLLDCGGNIGVVTDDYVQTVLPIIDKSVFLPNIRTRTYGWYGEFTLTFNEDMTKVYVHHVGILEDTKEVLECTQHTNY